MDWMSAEGEGITSIFLFGECAKSVTPAWFCLILGVLPRAPSESSVSTKNTATPDRDEKPRTCLISQVLILGKPSFSYVLFSVPELSGFLCILARSGGAPQRAAGLEEFMARAGSS